MLKKINKINSLLETFKDAKLIDVEEDWRLDDKF